MRRSDGQPRGKFSHQEVLLGERKSVLVGTVLGDACLAKHGHYHRLQVKHSLAQKDLVLWKYEHFQILGGKGPNMFPQHLNGKDYPAIRFTTRTSPELTHWARVFYPDGKKIVPPDIENLLDPLALATFIMDDGAADYAGLTLNTQSFVPEDVQRLSGALRNRYGLETSLRQEKHRYLNVYVPASSMDKLREIVGHHLVPSLNHKLIPRREREPRRDYTLGTPHGVVR